MSEETTLDEKKPETPDADTSAGEEPKATEEQDQDKPENEDQEAENDGYGNTWNIKDEKSPQEKKQDRKFGSNRMGKRKSVAFQIILRIKSQISRVWCCPHLIKPL